MTLREEWYEHLGPFKPEHCPEWGCGGIYGLLYHRGALIYTLAFNAKTYILTKEKSKVYNYELIGPPPRSGGDTYGATLGVDDKIYFGGWVHAPACFDFESKRLLFVRKYTHLHEVDLDSLEVKLLFKEGSGSLDKWFGEISDIVYNPLNNSLYLMRRDGHYNLGVFKYDRDKKEICKISEYPALRATIFLDYIIADAPLGVQLIDMINDKVTKINYTKIPSLDKGPSTLTLFAVASLRNKLYVFSEGGVYIGDPTGTYGYEPHSTFMRLFHMGSNCARYIPGGRSKIVPFAGGLLVPINIQDMATKPPRTAGPTGILLFLDESFIKVVLTTGRITSITTTPDSILIGTATGENAGLLSNRIDYSYKNILKLPHDIINRTPPPLTLTLTIGISEGRYFGGIPLTGYKTKRLIFRLKKENKLHIYEYDGSFKPEETEEDIYTIKGGKSVLDLGEQGYSKVVSFMLEQNDEKGKVYLECY